MRVLRSSTVDVVWVIMFIFRMCSALLQKDFIQCRMITCFCVGNGHARKLVGRTDLRAMLAATFRHVHKA